MYYYINQISLEALKSYRIQGDFIEYKNEKWMVLIYSKETQMELTAI